MADDAFRPRATGFESPRTRGPHAKWYTDEGVLTEERKRLFAAHWQLAGHEGQAPNPGDYLTTEVAGQDIILIRGRDEVMRAFYNVCPHRGHRLLDGCGAAKLITCPYHQWTFETTGRLRGGRGAMRDQVGLSPVRLNRLAGFLFICLDDDTPDLCDYAPDLEAQMLAACPDLLSYRVADGAEGFGNTYYCDANWKVMIDNFLECHHCDAAHPTFSDMMCIADNRFSLHQNFTYQEAPVADKAENAAFPLNRDHDALVGKFWFLFPNTAMGQFPGVPGFYASRFDPVTPHRTSRETVTLTTSTPDADAARRDRLRTEWNEQVVSREDAALCENVQRGMRQKGFDRGWYVTDPDAHDISEHAMRYFHDLYLTAMGADDEL